MFKYLSLDAEEEPIEERVRVQQQPMVPGVGATHVETPRPRVPGVNILGVFHKLCRYKTESASVSYNSDYVAGTDAAVKCVCSVNAQYVNMFIFSLMSFLNFDLEVLSSAVEFYEALRDTPNPDKVFFCIEIREDEYCSS